MSNQKPRNRRKLFVSASLIALLLGFLLVKQYVVGFYKLPQSGMYPTISAGSYFFASRLAYSDSTDVKRGDIVVFHHDWEGQRTVFIWRVVGLPGDTIEVTEQGVSINGSVLPIQKIEDRDGLAIYRETNGQATYTIAIDPAPRQRPADFSGMVPADHFFLMGDNRNNALDSRYLGFIPFNAIIARRF